jgi:hypothetical protein
MLTLDSLQAAWRDGYRYGWVLRDAVKFASPPVTYDHTLSGSSMGVTFTKTKSRPRRRFHRA